MAGGAVLFVASVLAAGAHIHEEAAPASPEKWCFRKDLGEGLAHVPEGCTNLHLASKPLLDSEVSARAAARLLSARL